MNKEDLFSIYIRQFSLDREVKLKMNKDAVITDDDILKSISKADDLLSGDPSVPLSEKDRTDLIKIIESNYAIYQEEGGALIGDYDHDFDWYSNLLNSEEYKEYYWTRYKTYLKDENRLPDGVIDTLENKTLFKIMSYLGNPADKKKYSIRGLVVGDVQSGKTSNYIGLITKAADAGYKVIFVLTGTIEGLRRQTQERIEEGFVGFDTVNGMDVGVGRGERIPKSYTSRNKDFTGTDDQNTTFRINESEEPMIFVLKKNVSVLKKVYSTLKRINTRFSDEKIDIPMLVIDDEADNASINTNDKEENPTKINEQIRKILSLFKRNSYVGFTATPFANVFISYDSEDDMLADDLFPRDFIYALKTPSNYCGAKKYFYSDNKNVVFISDDDQAVFPMNHKKDYEVQKLYKSVYYSLYVFVLINAIRDTYDISKNSHRSMMINMSRFTSVQSKLTDEIENSFEVIRKNIKISYKLPNDKKYSNKVMHKLKKVFDEQFEGTHCNFAPVKWSEIVENLYDAIKDIKIITVNSSKRSSKLDYEANKENGLRVIAIGGLALSRGLTLEGLCVSYFYRNTATYDVLMQMGRWFGYRGSYEELCRIFITEKSRNYYKKISEATEKLKEDITIMGKQGKRPDEYGIRVMNDSSELGITARNKMRDTSQKVDRKQFYGDFFETPYLYKDLQYNTSNIKATEEFLSHINNNCRDYSVGHPYFRDIDSSAVIEFIRKLCIHEASSGFDVKQISKFLELKKHEIPKFDVLIMGGSSEKTYTNNHLNIKDMKLVKRQFDIRYSDELIRINAQRAHLIGKTDSANGLTDEEIKKAIEGKNKIQTKDYLIEQRNPLIAIYFVDLNNENRSTNYPENEKNKDDKFLNELHSTGYDFMAGYCIFFPSKYDDQSQPDEIYYVNNTVNYYEKMHEEVIDNSFEETADE